MRIDKLLANSGVGTRKEVKGILKGGLVSVNKTVIKDPSFHVDPVKDEISVSGEPIRYREFVYLMMYKPEGVLSATEDLRDTTAVDLLDEEYDCFDVAPAGRLDKDSEGLLLLTNNGGLIHSVISPKKHVNKRYAVEVNGRLEAADAEAFKNGIQLDDGYMTLPGELIIQETGEQSKAHVVIHEGKFRQIRRMMAACGKEVTFLKRLEIGPLKLDEFLEPGEYRELTETELEELILATGYKGSK